MKAKDHPSSGIKFAEAAVLFVLILGLTVFVGVKMASQEDTSGALPVQDPVVTMAQQPAVPEMSSPEEVLPDTAVVATTEVEPQAAEPVVPELTPPEPVSYAQAEDAYFQGNYDQAVDLFTFYTLQNPQNAWGHYMLGMSLWKAEDPEGAEESFQAALLINPDHVKSLINKGRVQLEMNRPSEAGQTLLAAVALAPDNVQAQRVLARAQNSAGQHAQAEASYREILAGHPDDIWSLNNLGLLMIQEERFDEALPALAHAAQLQPDLAAVQNNLGVALERSGYISAAKTAYAQTIALDANYGKAQASLARLEKVTEAEGLAEFDLAATAAAFSSQNVLAERNDLALATTTPPTATEAKPEQTADKNR